jgi:hypothetical protein
MFDYIPERHGQILWSEDDKGKVIAVRVIHYRNTESQEKIAESYDSSGGADTYGWLTYAHPCANPAALFASLAFGKGFADRAVATECVREFAQLDGCEWARRMLAALVNAES